VEWTARGRSTAAARGPSSSAAGWATTPSTSPRSASTPSPSTSRRPPSAGARRRFPDSAVDYVVADLLDLPPEWHRAFDLVVEVITVQALPDPPRARAIACVASLVAPGGTLIVISAPGVRTTRSTGRRGR
jgi:hypothetical protein